MNLSNRHFHAYAQHRDVLRGVCAALFNTTTDPEINAAFGVDDGLPILLDPGVITSRRYRPPGYDCAVQDSASFLLHATGPFRAAEMRRQRLHLAPQPHHSGAEEIISVAW